ncbi:Putative uncharacterized protein [Taphrina deformans PYCC 5710]|uniref:Pyridoxamine 5'-phosphate oxidase Alr4036 family FMN-binding domain-containing protein n=1 Tax=Taphrina deformans (strain PYCC 5710 / ATCC 11124 / CBS 356.35 / IMI 108563 / JCM 9778 / NBRC 8474) TaxID=1097556 RepID=R4XEH9_TAPDE|nr:Putative uncharacterized protein [Taphrina deformans PYCC 5710]|eukprot:CCG82881.1 Putative uncharacterized protein [Taphrina deformans PYCC 5710]
MSSKTSPPWKEVVEKTLAENMKQGSKDSLNIQLATMPVPGASQHPSVRTVVFRGFVGQPRKDDEPSGGNPIKDVTSSLIVASSDRLMLKSEQILQQQKSGSGNGFEVCWWHQGTQEQIRLSGRAWLLTSNQDENASFPEKRLRDLIDVPQDGDKWTWEGERRRQFAKHSPGLRASFQNPHPASPLTHEKEEAVKAGITLPGSLEEAKDEEEAGKVKEALKRFCLVILECEEVDYLKSEPFPPARKQWKLQNGEWSTQEVSP